MSDLSLRQLERRWGETGGAADEAAYLRARVSAGDLAPELLRLAGHCGYEPALMALNPEVAERLRRKREHFEGWAWALGEWGRETAFRALLAIPSSPDETKPDWEGASLEEIDEVLSNLGYHAYGAAMGSEGPRSVREAVAAQLVPWALGYHDPLPRLPWAQ